MSPPHVVGLVESDSPRDSEVAEPRSVFGGRTWRRSSQLERSDCQGTRAQAVLFSK